MVDSTKMILEGIALVVSTLKIIVQLKRQRK